MNQHERDYWRSIGMIPEKGSPLHFLGEWMATPEGQALYARLKVAAERMDAHIPRSYRRGDPTWGEAHKDELPDIVECYCGEIVRRWSWGEKRNYPQGGPHLCPLDGPKVEHPKQPVEPQPKLPAQAKPESKEKKSPDFLV